MRLEIPAAALSDLTDPGEPTYYVTDASKLGIMVDPDWHPAVLVVNGEEYPFTRYDPEAALKASLVYTAANGASITVYDT